MGRATTEGEGDHKRFSKNFETIADMEEILQ